MIEGENKEFLIKAFENVKPLKHVSEILEFIKNQ
jgi:hypothetical protein|tara:strand:- start:355 stop:456 length:102 start_codon:yes stop_codon:yes gene_type:complete